MPLIKGNKYICEISRSSEEHWHKNGYTFDYPDYYRLGNPSVVKDDEEDRTDRLRGYGPYWMSDNGVELYG